MFTVILLVCSMVATPDRRDCVLANSVRHELLGQADSAIGCAMAAELLAAQIEKYRSGIEYPKILCVRTDLPSGRNGGPHRASAMGCPTG